MNDTNEIYLNTDGDLTAHYNYANIYLDTFELNKISARQRKATCVHEFGHAMGLSHNNMLPTSIMCQLGEGRTATRAGLRDYKAINYLYANENYSYK